MFIFYDLIFFIVALFYLPIYLFKGKFHRGFLARLGILPRDRQFNAPVWIHAVSVGEAKAVRKLAEGLRHICPDKEFLISTVTPTGNKIAIGFAREKDYVTYLPLDLSFIIGGAIDRIRPSLFILAETEIWPNLIYSLSRSKIPIIVVNGRISDASFKGYLCAKFLLKPVLRKIDLFCVQTERDASRLGALGVKKEKIRITGNMKFDIALDMKLDAQGHRRKLGLKENGHLFVAGSTHGNEEKTILGAYKELLEEFPELKLLIAPRHPERSKGVAEIVSRFGFHSIFLSDMPFEYNCPTRPVFILDTIGQLVSFYNIASFVFVGGSLVKKGGQNILEPAFLAKPVLFGPHMFNFRDIAEMFLNSGSAIMVRDEQELREQAGRFLRDPALAARLGERARQLIFQNQGATQRNLQQISKILVSRPVPC
jgi:3-deoxy-D-manno-octulosonic-acid transferase